MSAYDVAHVLKLGPATQPPTSQQRRLAYFAAAFLVATFAIMVPFASKPLPRLDAFIPFLETMVSTTAIITSVMFYSKFSTYRSRPILVLASGYLFVGLIVIPHILNFPGAFSPEGLFGTGNQSAKWLYRFWHLGFALTLVIYAQLINMDAINGGAIRISKAKAVAWSIAIVFSVTCALAWATTLDYPPSSSSWAFSIPVVTLSLCIYALVRLWMRRRTTVLDLWLFVAACAEMLEVTRGSLLNPGAFYSVGFYLGRTLSACGSVFVLAVLLSEFEGLYANLANSNSLLMRERANKLMNMEAMVASVSHEVRQPLTAIATNGGAALRFLRRKAPDLEEVRLALNRMIAASHQASEVFENIRALFGSSDRGREAMDVNEVILAALHALHGELEEHGVKTQTELTLELPLVIGHRGQLQEVILNLARNAIEAMDDVKPGNRELLVKTAHDDRDAITVEVQDTGLGIDPKKLDHIFEAFITTKLRGMGLGLAICRMIVERHGGQLSASSDGKSGALFQFNLPTQSAMSKSAEPLLDQ